jgi:hypothetical protein
MAGSISGLNVFATQSGPIPLAQLDSNISTLTTALNNLQNFDNYYVDSGAANSITVTVLSPQIVAYTAGLTLQIKVAASNTGATTINVNGLGNVAVVTPNGAALISGAVTSGGIYQFQYDGTSFQLQNANYSTAVKAIAYAVKTANTARASTTTLTNDPDLVYAIPSAGTYQISGFINASYLLTTIANNGGMTLNLNYSGTFTSGQTASPLIIVGGNITPATTTATYVSNTIQASAASASIQLIQFASSTGTYFSQFMINATLIATGTGTLGLAWAQAVSNVNATTLYAGSSLTITKIV